MRACIHWGGVKGGLCVVSAAALLSGCGGMADQRIKTLEIQVRNLESDLRLLKYDLANRAEAQDETVAVVKGLAEQNVEHVETLTAIAQEVDRHRRWIGDVESRAASR